MDISKWKVEIYDLLGIILPGLLAISIGWICVSGWQAFALSISRLTATGLTLLVLVAFGAGTLVQELSDFVVTLMTDKRFSKRARDEFWSSDEATPVKMAIETQVGMSVSSVDTALDLCLTRLKGHFPRRDMFVATADLCRSFAILSLVAVIPASQAVFQAFDFGWRLLLWLGICLGISAALFSLAWRRVVRFRELSEKTVFRAYLATVEEPESQNEFTPSRKP